MRPPILLAIETSQRVGGVAVGAVEDAAVVHVEMLRPESRHDDDLLPAIDRLFARCGLAPGDLKGGSVGVSVGPGGFTGLRIAISTARMFAEALGARCIAVPSALVPAEPISARGPILVALASKKDTVWCTRLEHGGGHWRISTSPAPALIGAAELPLEEVAGVVADEHLPAQARALCDRRGVPIIEPVFHPSACLTIARRMLAAGEVTDPLSLLPLYPREPEAVTLWNARHVQSDFAT